MASSLTLATRLEEVRSETHLAGHVGERLEASAASDVEVAGEGGRRHFVPSSLASISARVLRMSMT
jgi:hypothetical protein